MSRRRSRPPSRARRPPPALRGSSPRGGPPSAPVPAHASGRGPWRGRPARPRGRSTARRRRPSCGRETAGRSSGRSRRRRGSVRRPRSASIGQARTGTPRRRASSSSPCSSTRPTSVWPATAPVPPRRVAGFAPGIARSASRTGSPLQSGVVGTPYARASPFTRQWKTAAPAQALNAAGKTCAGPRGGRPPSPRTSARNARRQGLPARPAATQRSRGHDHWWSMPKRTRRPARVASTSARRRASRSVSRVKGPATLRGRPPGRAARARSLASARKAKPRRCSRRRGRCRTRPAPADARDARRDDTPRLYCVSPVSRRSPDVTSPGRVARGARSRRPRRCRPTSGRPGPEERDRPHGGREASPRRGGRRAREPHRGGRRERGRPAPGRAEDARPRPRGPHRRPRLRRLARAHARDRLRAARRGPRRHAQLRRGGRAGGKGREDAPARASGSAAAAGTRASGTRRRRAPSAASRRTTR